MKIVLDNKIPYIRETIAKITDNAVYLCGNDICAEDVKDADALIVRTRTRCDEKLLSGSKVKFVATATIGYDHIDTEYMEKAGIFWMNCPGCNASSVAQYIRSTLILLCLHKGLFLKEAKLGIVGCGHVGTLVKKVAEELEMKVLVNDPPRKDNGDVGDFVPLEVIEKECDVITFHVPLIKGGKYNSYHLANEEFFKQLKRQPFLINTSRGSVIDNTLLLNSLEKGIIRDAVIDTWENEPNINTALLNKVYIGTPHIAGYSADGKVNADNMVIDGLCRFFGIKNMYHIEPPDFDYKFKLSDNYKERCLQLYNPLIDSTMLKSEPYRFEEIRGNYPIRREKI
jgi:erythronate-4-phosphate dehydrogenase